MKRTMIMTAILVLGTVSISFCQMRSSAYPFSMRFDSAATLMRVFGEPKGYTRYPDAKMDEYQYWLTNLPLIPLNLPSARWDGQILMRADSIGGVIDLGVATENQKDADIPIQLKMEYYRVKGVLGDFPIIVGGDDTLSYSRWLSGQYRYDSHQNLIYTPGERREDSDTEYYRFLQLALSLNDNKTLLKNLVPIDEKDLAPGSLYVQFKKDDPDSVGHTAVILDICINQEGDRLFLAAWGGNPAQSFTVARPWPPGPRIWMTLDELKARLQAFGEGRFYRYMF